MQKEGIKKAAFAAFRSWCLQESNQGHKDFQSFALPTELRHQRGAKIHKFLSLQILHLAQLFFFDFQFIKCLLRGQKLGKCLKAF
ncbi:MAG: hypothetical protein RLZZ46_62 [Bacteroidota bacterium]